MFIVPRNTPRAYYQHLSRLWRCIARAQRESGSMQRVMGDTLIYGQGAYTQEMQQVDTDRTMQLMEGLKP